MIMPGVQNPHCRPWLSRNAACIGCSSSPLAMPSMVVTLEPEACPASTVQDFTARPSIWTTQAPHWLVSQPTCVPVRFRWSRKTWTRSVRSSTSTETALPFTVSLTVDTYPSPNDFCLGGLETGEAIFATGNFVAVVTERSSDMSSEVLDPQL